MAEKMGRPTELKNDMFDTAKKCIVWGQSIKGTCKMLGIARSTWYQWKKRAEKKNPKEDDKIYIDFFEMVNKSLAQCELNLIIKIQKDSSWQSSHALLKRRFYEDWGDKQAVETHDLDLEEKLKDGSNIDVDALSDEEQEQLGALLEKAKRNDLEEEK